MEAEGSLSHSQEPATSPYPTPDESSPCFSIPLRGDPVYYCSSIYACVFQSVFFPRVSPSKPFINLSSCMLRALPFSFSLIWSPEQYLARSTEHKAPRYVVFSCASLTFQKLRALFCSLLSDFWKDFALWEVPRLLPFVLVRATLSYS